MKLDSYFKPCTNINSKGIRDLNLRAKYIKLLEEKKHHNIGFSNDFLV